jgi:hypothetical protein
MHSSPALTDEEMQVWTDQILIPSIRSVCDPFVRQRQYPSWDNIRSRSSVKHEIFLTGAERGSYISLRRPIPEADLECLWAEIERRCNSDIHWPRDQPRTDTKAFREPQLFIIGHDLKTLTRSDQFNQIKPKLDELLGRVFHFTAENFRPGSIWLDWAREVVPEKEGFIFI